MWQNRRDCRQPLTGALRKLRKTICAAIAGQEPENCAVNHILAWQNNRVFGPGELSLDPAATLLRDFPAGVRRAFLWVEEDGECIVLPRGQKFWNTPDAKRAFINGALSLRTNPTGTGSIETKSGIVMMHIFDLKQFKAHYLAKIGLGVPQKFLHAEMDTQCLNQTGATALEAAQAETITAKKETKPKTRPGPKPGTVNRYRESDRALYPVLLGLMNGDQSISKMSLSAATRKLANDGKIEGPATAESKAKRLRDRYTADHKGGN